MSYLQAMVSLMRAFSLISECYMIDSVSILFNGSIYGKVKVEWGLRQRDPVSFYLFILFSRLFSHMILELEGECKIWEFK